MESHAHDDLHGGYFVFYDKDGTPTLTTHQGLGEVG
jgi:hypothetical protein